MMVFVESKVMRFVADFFDSFSFLGLSVFVIVVVRVLNERRVLPDIKRSEISVSGRNFITKGN